MMQPNDALIRFEDRLMTEFTINPACKGAAFARDYGPDATPSAAHEAVMRRPHWELGIDFVTGEPAQAWSLQYLGEDGVTPGEGATEAKMASDVCAIIRGQGAAPPR